VVCEDKGGNAGGQDEGGGDRGPVIVEMRVKQKRCARPGAGEKPRTG
jgi:hypothetical protein